jgi:hypothetical protein
MLGAQVVERRSLVRGDARREGLVHFNPAGVAWLIEAALAVLVVLDDDLAVLSIAVPVERAGARLTGRVAPLMSLKPAS